MHHPKIALLISILTVLIATGCGSEEKATDSQSMITAFEVKKAAIGRCQKEIKKITGTNPLAPSSDTQSGMDSVTLNWNKDFSAVCVYKLHKGITSLTVDGKSVIQKSE